MELRPAALDHLGLVKAIRNLTQTWSVRCHIDVDFEARNYEPTGISSEIETTLYGVIQEGLNNIAKHSGAKRVGLILRRAADHIQTIIDDDGRGFGTADARSKANGCGRLGPLGIRERLGNIGGSLNVKSTPGRGVTLVVCVPILQAYAKEKQSS